MNDIEGSDDEDGEVDEEEEEEEEEQEVMEEISDYGSSLDYSDSDSSDDAGAQYCDIFEIFNFSDSIPQENMVLVMEDCGEPISDLLDQLTPYGILSIIKQMITGMMIAEVLFEFEHRDLHSGNILLQPVEQSTISYVFRSKKICIASHGYRVKLIDTTFSRIRIR